MERWTMERLEDELRAAGRRTRVRDWAERSGWSVTVCQRMMRRLYGPGKNSPPIYEGSVAWRLLLAAVSEPGKWTPREVAEDYGATTADERHEYAARATELRKRGLLSRGPHRRGKEIPLRPTKEAQELWTKYWK